MSRNSRPRRHLNLTREAIARAALELVDRDGVAALSLRNVAGELGVAAMTLYRHVPNREAMVGDVVALLLEEIDLGDKPELGWEEGAKEVGRSLRAMALRHPRAFELVAGAASDRSPLVAFAARLRRFYLAKGVPADAFEEVWSILDAFETGFLLLETQAFNRPAPQAAEDLGRETEELAARMPSTLSAAAYEEGLDIIVSGLARRLEVGPRSG
jgi:AcrR family transcriptional regulator